MMRELIFLANLPSRGRSVNSYFFPGWFQTSHGVAQMIDEHYNSNRRLR